MFLVPVISDLEYTGVALLVFGSVFFITTSQTTMSDQTKIYKNKPKVNDFENVASSEFFVPLLDEKMKDLESKILLGAMREMNV